MMIANIANRIFDNLQSMPGGEWLIRGWAFFLAHLIALYGFKSWFFGFGFFVVAVFCFLVSIYLNIREMRPKS